MGIGFSAEIVKDKHEEEKIWRRKSELIREICELKEKMSYLENEYLLKKKEKIEAIDIYISKRRILEQMMEVKNNKTFRNVAELLNEQIIGTNYSQLMECYDGAMSAINEELMITRQNITDKTRELDTL